MRSIFLISRALNARKRKIFALFFALAASVGMSWAQQLEPVAPEGALDGAFTINANGDKISFSKGNLQLVGENTWQFAATQWECFGASQSDTHRDLFGWGTGSNPTLSSTDYSDYSTFTDWGVNAISNGGNTADTWRTLTKDEWVYLFYGRTNAATLFGLGSVNGVNGTILLPDNWTLPEGAGRLPSARFTVWKSLRKPSV